MDKRSDTLAQVNEDFGTWWTKKGPDMLFLARQIRDNGDVRELVRLAYVGGATAGLSIGFDIARDIVKGE